MQFQRLCFLMIGSSLLASGAVSAATSDFVCVPAEKTHAVYFENQVRNCGDAKADVKKGVCQEDVQCAFVDSSTQQAMEAEYSRKNPKNPRSFSSIPLADKLTLLKNGFGMTLSYHPSVVTCSGAIVGGNAGGPMCPAPDQCKGDALIDSKTAMIDPAGTLQSALSPSLVVPGTDGAPSKAGSAQPPISREFE